VDKDVGGLISLGILLVAVAFIVSVVGYFRREREPEELHQRFLIRFYVYMMLFFSLLLIFIGTVFVLRGILSYLFGLSFSYTGSPMWEEGTPDRTPKFLGIRYDERERLVDMVSGMIVGITGLIVYMIHRVLEKRVEPAKLSSRSFLKQSYLMNNAVLYGGLTIYAVPVGIYSVLKRYLIHTEITGENYWAIPVPGTILSVAIVALPLWISFIMKLQTAWKSSGI